jgi:hypothetical protein
MTTSIPKPVARLVSPTGKAHLSKAIQRERSIAVRTASRKKVSLMSEVQRRDGVTQTVMNRKHYPSEIIYTQWTAIICTLHDGRIVRTQKTRCFNTQEDATAWAEDALDKACRRAYESQGRRRRSGQQLH